MKFIFIIFQILKRLAILAFCLILWHILFPVFVIVTLCLTILFIYRKLVDLCIVGRCHPEWIPVRPSDCMYGPGLNILPDLTIYNFGGLFETENPIFDKKTTLHVLRESFKSNIMQMAGDPFWKMMHVPRKLYGFYYWSPINDFESHLEEYIHELDFKKEIQRPRNIDELHNYLMNHWISTNFEDKSPWEMVVAETTDGQRSIAFRCHHMIGGGMSVRWFLNALNGKSVADSMAPFMRKQKPGCFRFLWNFFQLTHDLLTLPWTLLYLSCVSVVGLCSDKFGKPQRNCTEVTTAEHVISVDTVKRISKHFKTPFRTVLASTLGSAMRNLELESFKESRLPPRTEILVNLPWLYAQLDPTEPLNNTATSCFVNYPIKCSSATERLMKTQENIQNALSNRVDRFFFYARYLTYVIPASIIRGMFLNSASVANSSSDCPITEEKRFPLGDQYLKCAYWLPGLLGTKIGCIALFGTVEKFLTFTISASQERISTNSRAERLCYYFQQELEYLEEFIDSSSEAQYILPRFAPTVINFDKN